MRRSTVTVHDIVDEFLDTKRSLEGKAQNVVDSLRPKEREILEKLQAERRKHAGSSSE